MISSVDYSPPFQRFLELPLVAQSAKAYSRGYQMFCPAHNDVHKRSLVFWEDDADGHVGICCFAGCTREDVCKALGIRESQLYRRGHDLPHRPALGAAIRTLDLLDLAVQKRIPPVVLIDAGVSDGYSWRPQDKAAIHNVVRIPYLQEDGTPYLRTRIRTAVTASRGSYWEGQEAPLIPYGLWKLEDARKEGVLWLVEGESDCWTHWLHAIPTLGIPGAGNTRVLQAAYLRGIKTLYIVQEPTPAYKKQDAGKQFVMGIIERLKEIGYQGEVSVVSLHETHGVKDPNELHQKLIGEQRLHEYAHELAKAIRAATPLDLAATQQVPLAEVQLRVEAALVGEHACQELYALAPLVAGLSLGEQAAMLALIRAKLNKDTGFSMRTFGRLLKDEQQRSASANRIHVSNLPDIILTGDIQQDASATLAALYAANFPPVLFVRQGQLVRCRQDEDGRPLIEPLNESILLYEMARAATFLHSSKTHAMPVSCYPPLAVARHLLAAKEWKFPPLRGVTEVPVMRADGTVLDKAGYDAQTRLIYQPHPELAIPSIPARPTCQEVEQARDLAWDYLAEFPYESQADAANAFALLLTVVVRPLLDLVPLAVIDATKQGSGKGLLAKFVSYIAQGRSAAAMVPPNNEDEWRKTLTALLVGGETLISLDNVEGLLASPRLASFLTADLWKARLLGTMQSPDLMQRTLVMANGNNILLGGDIPRRAYRIRMDTGVSKPWQRTGFTYAPLLKYAKRDRGKIIAALLTMARAWFLAACPAPEGHSRPC